MHFHVLQLFPAFSSVWVARTGGCLVGTGSVVLWSPAGLPSSPSFGEAFIGLRREGRKVAEGGFHVPGDFGRLCVRSITRKLALSAIGWAAANGVDDLCVRASRSDLSLWSSKLGFDVFSVEQSSGEPADLLLRLDLRALRAGRGERKPWLAHLDLHERPAREIPGGSCKLVEDDVARLLLCRPDLCAALSVLERSLLRYCFPNALWLAERCDLFSVRTRFPVDIWEEVA